MREALLLSLLLLPACEPDKPTETGGDTGPDTGGDTSPDTADETGDDTATDLPLCADGTWGQVSDPADALFVTADGDDGGDGSRANPFRTLDAALAASRATGGPKRIAVGDGRFDAALALSDLDGDDGLAVEGCGIGATVLVGGEDAPALASAGVTGLVAAGFTVEGGRRAVMLTQAGSATLSDLAIEGATRAGILMDGSYGLLDVTLTDVTVTDVAAEADGGDEAYGYGIAIQSDLSAGDPVQVSLERVTVTNARLAGVLVSGWTTEVSATTLTVTDTLTHTGGALARGVQVQNAAILTAVGLAVTGGADAGVYAYESDGVYLTDVDISGVAAGADADGVPTGDGVVVAQDPDHSYDPADFPFALADVAVTDAPRAAVLLAGVEGTADETTASDIWTGSADGVRTYAEEGYAEPIVTQDGARVTVTGAGSARELGTTLATLSSYATPLSTDTPAE